MAKFAWNLSFILLLYVSHIIFTAANSQSNYKSARTNNDDLQTCLSSSLPFSVHTIYPCSTLTNQNSTQYQCDHFNIITLSAIRGARVSHSPAVVVYVTDSSDVQNVVKCATKLNYVVNALSGGHSYEGYGLGSTYNNIVINMEGINYININQNDRTGTAGTVVGLGGHTLGGGFGFLARLYGLLSDNILEMKAVNTQGELLTINQTHESELYWALRGAGGGLFVIVTEFKIRLFKAPSLVIIFSASWSSNATKLVMQQYQSLLFSDETLNLNNNLFLGMSVSTENVGISITYYGTELEELNKTKSLLLATLPTPNSMTTDREDWLTFVYKRSDVGDGISDNRQLLLENLTYPIFYFKAKHLFYDQPISAQSLDQLIQELASGDGPVYMGFNPWDGYLSTIPVDQTAFPHRRNKFGIQFTIHPRDEEDEKKKMDLLNRVYLAIYNDSTKHSFINYMDRDVLNWMDAYYDTHQQRLINIKNIYDKNNRLYFERTIELSGTDPHTFFNFSFASFVIYLLFIAYL